MNKTERTDFDIGKIILPDKINGSLPEQTINCTRLHITGQKSS